MKVLSEESMKADSSQALTGGFVACKRWQSHLVSIHRQSLGTSPLIGSFPGSACEWIPGGSATIYYAQIVELVSA